MVSNMGLSRTIRNITYQFDGLRELLAKASPYRSGDVLAGIASESGEQRAAAQMALADLPLRAFLQQAVVPYESDEVTRLIVDSHDPVAFNPVATLTVGEFRDWLLSDAATGEVLAAVTPG
jgi:ethanolamine ammonia-lyase large subunit